MDKGKTTFIMAHMTKTPNSFSLLSEDQDALKLPKSLEDLRRLNAILSAYIDQHFMNVYVTYFVTYI